jgi:DNA invertase Pin-like site-specific DNA recombinase
MRPGMNGNKNRVGIYVRVSTAGQSTKAQEVELRHYAQRRGWQVQRVYSDSVSGAKEKRPALNELLADCRRRRLDIVLVWKFDRFARSVKQLVTTLQEFHDLSIDFTSLTEQVDTTTAMGKMTFHVLGAVAELERSLIAERTVAGLREARRRGRVLGRPRVKLNSDLVARIKADRISGRMSFRKLAKTHGVTLWSIQRLAQNQWAAE